MNNVIELLPCPFCGAKPSAATRKATNFISRHKVACSNNGCGAHFSHWHPNEWNRRAAQAAAALPCDVMLPPATIIRRGCSFTTLLNALGLREGQPDELRTIERTRPGAPEELWAVHAQGPDELWAAESHEAAEQHAAALNALPGQTDTVKVNAIVIRSPWSEVEHWKTLAEQWRHEAEDRIASVQSTRAALENVTKVARRNLDLLDENTGLRTRLADLLHLLQYATITTPSNGDAEQAKVVMSELARMLATEQAPSARQQSEQARYRYLRDHCAREWDIHDYQEVLIRIPCGPSIAHCDDLDAIVDAAIAAKEASHA